ncbi:MAG: hypothetical protein M0Q53_09695 [Prolixibacteraceae bacterium]|jgi:hypothetical protein|nr:hypothetical protein [Prolixibacteraceae bacterium]
MQNNIVSGKKRGESQHIALLKVSMPQLAVIIFSLFIATLGSTANSQGQQLNIGVATADITPVLPVALDGQMYLRVAKEVETPLSASVLVMESRQGSKSMESVVFVSCELVAVPSDLLAMVRKEVHQRLPELDVNKIVMNAIHTHTAPVVRYGLYDIPKEITQIEAYYTFFTKRVSDAIEEAWKSRAPGSITWGLSQAKVGYNRRATYSDNSSKMYGKTNQDDFRGIEGYEDQNVNTLFVWNQAGKLTAVSIDVACPAQEVEHREKINADYWFPVRNALRKQFGPKLCVLGWIAAAGDQSPHLMYGQAGEERMRNLRKLDRLDEIARRVVNAVEDAYEVVKSDRHKEIKLVHEVEKISLPMRIVSDAEYEQCKIEVNKAKEQIAKDPKSSDQLFRKLNWEGDVVRRYEEQKTNPHPMYDTEIHVLRIGDVAVCTNSFELFTDYGIAIQARSLAVQTFVIQHVGPGTYLPTEKAVKGGSYSAIIESNLVGPEGGQILVDRTVKLINGMFAQ